MVLLLITRLNIVPFHRTASIFQCLITIFAIIITLSMALFKTKNAQIYLFFLTISLVSCRQKEPDLSKIHLQIQIERFDKALDSLTLANIPLKHTLWQKKYGQFYSDFTSKILQAGNVQDTGILFKNYRQILQNHDFAELKKSTIQTYPNLTQHEEALTNAFKHIKFYFPKAEVPRFISFFSGFTVQTPINTEYIGIGLDMFLGKNSKFYPALIKSIPFYISRRFTPENIVPRTVETYLRESLYPEPTFKKPDLLSYMIYNGKIMYLMDKMLPKLSDSLKIGYTKEQMVWAANYQQDIWAWFLEEDLLFDTDYQKIQKHLGDAPFTPELGNQHESAPKLGVFIGWQIVKKYMENHPSIPLDQLLQFTDAQQLLKDSKYKGLK
jgi:gliding motility-associated lipoprotein GldB